MKFIKFFVLIMVLSLCLSLVCSASTETAESEEEQTVETIEQNDLTTYSFSTDLEIRAKAAMLIELNSNTLLYEYQKDKQVYPASLTKIMTCMLAIEHGNPDDILTVSETALQNLSIFGSSAGLLEGEELPLKELLYCIMVSSANEGCNVIAEYIADDIPAFIDLMNQKAKELGMNSTHFANAHGLHDENHYTTAYDLSLLARWAWQNPQFREYATTTKHVVPATNISDARTLYSTNYLTATDVESKYYYSRAKGIKTGFTTPAGGCLISTASDGNLEFMSIVLGCSPQTADNGNYGDERFVETKKLFEYGFENVDYVQILTDTKMVDMQDVLYSDGRRSVVIRASEDVTVLMPISSNLSGLEFKVEYDSYPLAAPLKEGQQVGVVKAYYDGRLVATCPAVTLTAVERSTAEYVSEKVSDTVDTVATGIGKAASATKSWLAKHWYLFIPLILVAVLLIALLIIRAVNIRKAKKRRAERRRRNAERRHRDE